MTDKNSYFGNQMTNLTIFWFVLKLIVVQTAITYNFRLVTAHICIIQQNDRKHPLLIFKI